MCNKAPHGSVLADMVYNSSMQGMRLNRQKEMDAVLIVDYPHTLIKQIKHTMVHQGVGV